MKTYFTQDSSAVKIAIFPVKKANFSIWLAQQSTADKNWLQAMGITAEQTKLCFLPQAEGKIAKVICFPEQLDTLWSLAGLGQQLPAGVYEFEGLTAEQYELAALAWGLAAYKFTRYKSVKTEQLAKLFLPEFIDVNALNAQLEATYLVRDLINTPAENMGPAELSQTADDLAKQYKAKVRHIIGDELLAENFPAIHAVGRSSDKAPRLIDLTWGEEKHPKITLVGKGVCFDSGGLDLKSAGNMRLMKKDMGGAATVLGLAKWIMAQQLPVRLRVIIGAVENMVSGNSYRPGDVISTRKGLSIEIGNTDAEGRVVLSDCLALACEEKPDYLFDFATLTGAAKIGLGADIPSLFSNKDEFAEQLENCSKPDDLVWHMPLHQGYREFIDSSIADISNDSSSAYGGGITAALFLNEFVDSSIPWAHFDIMAWNNKTRPGRPEGGEAMAMRTVYRFIENCSK